MSNLAENAVYAKVRTRFGNRIDSNLFVQLSQSGSVLSAVEILKQTKYKNVLTLYKESVWHRGSLERLLKNHSFLDIESLCNYEKSLGKDLFYIVMLEYEINEILFFTRLLLAGKSENYGLYVSFELNRFTDIDLVALSRVKTVNELREFLRPTRYKKYVNEFLKNDSIDISALELALDKAYYTKSVEKIKKAFSGDVKKELLYIFSFKAEYLDLCFIYRMLKFYPDDLKTMRFSTTGVLAELKEDEQKALFFAETKEEFESILKTTAYGKNQESYASVPNLLENAYKKFVKRLIKNIHFSSSSAVVLLSYILYLGAEAEDLTHVIEGLRYSLDQNEILNMLTIYNAERSKQNG